MKKQKVLIYIHQGIQKGGVEKVFHTIINNLPSDRYDITVLSVMGYLTDDFDAPLYPNTVKRHCMMWDEFSKDNVIRRVLQKIHNRLFPPYYKFLLKLKKFDIAIAAQEGFYASFVIENVKAHRKYLWIHNDVMQCHWTAKMFPSLDAEAACYRQFSKVICVSHHVAQSMSSLFGKMDNLHICYNPINTPEIDAKLQEPAPERPGTGVWFVCIGRLAHQKGYDRLLEICRRLNDKGYRYRYCISILGEGADRAKLELKISEYQLGNVELCGNQTNPFKYMKAADWVLTPSRHEGFCLALWEATYCGVPSIITDVAGARELLGNSEYGIITENSEEQIYTAIKSVLDQPRLHEHYQAAARKRAPFISLNTRIADIVKAISK